MLSRYIHCHYCHYKGKDANAERLTTLRSRSRNLSATKSESYEGLHFFHTGTWCRCGSLSLPQTTTGLGAIVWAWSWAGFCRIKLELGSIKESTWADFNRATGLLLEHYEIGFFKFPSVCTESLAYSYIIVDQTLSYVSYEG